MKKKGFTLIELIAVLVIMAILALIVVPLVMSIIRKARVSADKRSIDAYGRSIELAIAGYLLDTGKFPTSVEQLTIEYSGNEVVCSTTQLNSDSSVYLTGCTVAGRSVDYAYGKEEAPTYQVYSVGDEVRYNNIDYRVIKDSDSSEKSVILLKAEPLSVEEVNIYGEGHLNFCTSSHCSSTAGNSSGYGTMTYYTSSTCGYNEGNEIFEGCTTSYVSSEIKYAVDAWKDDQAPGASEARLITYDELVDNLGYENTFVCTGGCYYDGSLVNVPTWVYSSNYSYFTMTQAGDIIDYITIVNSEGTLGSNAVYSRAAIRPVIVLSKSVLASE